MCSPMSVMKMEPGRREGPLQREDDVGGVARTRVAQERIRRADRAHREPMRVRVEGLLVGHRRELPDERPDVRNDAHGGLEVATEDPGVGVHVDERPGGAAIRRRGDRAVVEVRRESEADVDGFARVLLRPQGRAHASVPEREAMLLVDQPLGRRRRDEGDVEDGGEPRELLGLLAATGSDHDAAGARRPGAGPGCASRCRTVPRRSGTSGETGRSPGLLPSRGRWARRREQDPAPRDPPPRRARRGPAERRSARRKRARARA